MSDTVIKVENLGKKYIIGHQQSQQGLRHTINDSLIDLGHKLLKPSLKTNKRIVREEFWALKDVSFEVKQGDVVGIIGRNGAGKSTLLKILSRITEPTSGRISLKGRVASLLEVGTGFHPELTGRENIYLNGAILGMSREEIRRKFDEIVAFAEIEKFLDTPVKRYSSGMCVRLAFAVAAHLEPEILVVDEVLAVGDAEFQKKCLGKMSDVAKQKGRTVLFVSHNMAAVHTLCKTSLLLKSGDLIFTGSTQEAVGLYLSSNKGNHKNNGFYDDSWERSETNHISPLSIENVRIKLEGEQPNYSLIIDSVLKSRNLHKPAFMAIDILSPLGSAIMQPIPTDEPFINNSPDLHNVRIAVTLPPLVPGQYSITIWTGSHYTETYDEVKECVSFEILESPTPNRTVAHYYDHGFIVPESKVEYRVLC